MIIEHLLEVKQNHPCVGDPSKKFATGNKTKLLGSERMGLESKQLEVIRLGYLVV
jgi:hypothetical protein